MMARHYICLEDILTCLDLKGGIFEPILSEIMYGLTGVYSDLSDLEYNH